MKKTLIILLLINTIVTRAQEYDNLGQKLRIHNFIMGKSIINGEMGLGISQLTYKPVDAELIDYTRFTTNIGIDIKPKSHFHIKTQIFIDLIKNEKAPPYLSNLYYQIGWYNWENNSISFGYENYGPNRFNTTTNWGTNFMRGFFFASYNIDILYDNASLKYDESSQIRLTPIIRYIPEYTDKNGVKKAGNHKFVLGSSVRWSIANNFYIESAAYYYPSKETQLPWDPDFTYGFGYFDWRPFTISVSYGNWIANRYPWKEKEMQHGFLNGELKANFRWSL
jgi:hypothetical protein